MQLNGKVLTAFLTKAQTHLSSLYGLLNSIFDLIA